VFLKGGSMTARHDYRAVKSQARITFLSVSRGQNHR
jgi:hypothetical protein